MQKLENVKDVQAAAVYEKELELNGSIFGIIEGKGRHVTRAQTLMGGDAERWFPALMHCVVRVNDRQEPMEFYEDMPMGDFMSLMSAINDMGFTGLENPK